MKEDTKANHPLQSFEWGKFRQKSGVKVVKSNGYQITIHAIPHTPFNIGYFPKGPLPDKKMITELLEIGKREKCIFIQLEPDVIAKSNVKSPASRGEQMSKVGLRAAAHPLFTKYTFVLDLIKSDDELLKNMHSKTRYNIKVAQKHGVEIVEDNSDEAFEQYLKLTRQTTQRQGFFAHNEEYHQLMWETLRPQMVNGQWSMVNGQLSAHLFLARYKDEVLAAWILFVFKDTLYYPYGASSDKHRETMASNLMMWEVIKFGKKIGLKKFDMWGSLGPNSDEKDPWYGFHKFKQGYGAVLTEFIGSYDLVINKPIYALYKIADKIRWLILRKKAS